MVTGATDAHLCPRDDLQSGVKQKYSLIFNPCCHVAVVGAVFHSLAGKFTYSLSTVV